MRAVVIGGTGFIGQHVVNQLLSEGKDVTLLSLSIEGALEQFDNQVTAIEGNLYFMSDADFENLFEDADVLIYAAGADERRPPEGDAYEFFYKENVATCVNVLKKAKAHGIKHALVMGSIFTHVNREKPEMRLSHYHPYIRSRAEQQAQSLELADDSFQVNIIEVPYVFGAAPGCETIWKNILNYVRIANPLMVSSGGANVISVSTLAQAICGVINHVNESGPEPVGDENMSWETMLQRLSQCHNGRTKKVITIKDGLFNDLTRMGSRLHDLLNMKSGLDQSVISEIIMNESFLETDSIKTRLGYQGGDVDQAFRETLESCPAPSIIAGINRSLDKLNDSTMNYLKKLDHRASENQ